MGGQRSNKSIVPLKSKLKKDPGIPRLPNVEDRSAKRRRVQERPTSPRLREDEDATMPTITTLAFQAEAEASSSLQIPNEEELFAKIKEQTRRHYIRTLHKVIDQSDIVILVLDARDPEGCRSRIVEEEVRRREGEGKKLVFVLNKIDLIPRENAQQWLRHLRHSTPTLPFRSASQTQRNNLSSNTAPSLLKLLKAYKPSAAQSITVGVVGFPNVGKSSLINSLKRAKACAVAAQPGHTKDLQSIQLERGIRIVDSPGVVFDELEDVDGKGGKKGSIFLRNVVKVEDIPDPIAVVEEILSRTQHDTLQKIYNLPHFQTIIGFLAMLAMASGKLLRGGTADIIAAARQVITDWNHHKIPYFSIPPSIHPSSIPSVVPNTNTAEVVIAPGAENVGQAQILGELGKPFELEGLFGSADARAFECGDEDEEMMDRQEWDGKEVELMDEDRNQMKSDDLTSRDPRKRSLSPSVLSPEPTRPRAPKRLRRTKYIPEYDAPIHAASLEKSNPMSRKVLKKAAKRARRANREAADAGGRGMEVDGMGDGGLEFTFMATTEGVSF